MNFWTYLHLFCFIVYTVVFFYIIIKNPYSIVNWVLALLFLCFSIWSACNAMIYTSFISLENATEVIKIQSIGWASFITYYLLFILMLAGRKKILENVFTYVVLLGVPMLFIYQAFSGNMLICCKAVPYGLTAEWKHSAWTFFYYAYYTVVFILGVWVLFDLRNRTVIKTEKKMADMLLISAATVFAVGTLVSVVMKHLDIYLPVDANVTFLVFVVGLIYCAEKYEMLSLTGPRIADKVMNSINEGLLLLGKDGEVLGANTAAIELFGGGKAGSFNGSAMQECAEKVKYMLEKGTEDFEMTLDVPAGGEKTAAISVRSIEDIKSGSGSVAIIRDITSKKNAEAALVETVEDLKRSNDELESFAYVASHDLKEPLRMVASYIQLLKKRSVEKFSQDELDYINFVSDGATRMDSLISDLLEYSRVKTKGEEFKETDFNAVFSKVLDILKFRIQDKNAKVTGGGSLPVLNADTIQMEQLLQNLIENALKFSGKEPPEIKVNAVKKGRYYEFSVADNGIGIDMQFKDRIFQVFQRLHAKNEYGGTGIGLAICKKIVERHKGRIWMESEGEGRGSTFFFTLPV